MKNLILLFILIYSYQGFAQNEPPLERGFHFHSITITPIGAYINDRHGGALGNISIGVAYKKNIVKAYLEGGGEVNLFGSGESILEFGGLYGKEFDMSRKLSLDVFAGIGYTIYNFPSTFPAIIEDTESYAIPFEVSLRWKLAKVFQTGFRLKASYNEIAPYINPGFFMQFRF
jgi:hypothetical protein